MKPRPHNRRTHGQSQGFSTVEMAVSVAIIMVLAGIASPFLLRTLRLYQLNDSATRLAGLLKLTRFEAIRNNTRVACGFRQNGATWILWKDSIPNGQPDPQEVQLVLGTYADMLPAAAAPNPAPIAATIGGGGALALGVVSGANGSIAFDARGAVDFGANPPAVFVLYLGSADATPGYRAVLVFPSGATQVWSCSAAGDWRRTS
jgi:hypothetical protein